MRSRQPASARHRILERWFPCVLLATAAAAAVALGSLQSVIWNGVSAPPLARALASLLDPGLVASTGAPANTLEPGESYFANGRLALAIYVMLLLGWQGLRAQLPAWRYPASLATLTLALSGDVLAYWVSSVLGPDVRRVGFWFIEVPALAMLVLGLTIQGLARLRTKGTGRVLLLTLPAALGGTMLLRYLPHGALAGLAAVAGLTAAWAAPTVPLPITPRSAVPRALGVVIAVGLLGILYRPRLVPGDIVTGGEFIIAPPEEGVRLHVFNTGWNRMSWLLVGDSRPWRPVPAFVLEHPRHGLIVFDTGVSPEVAEAGESALPAPMRWVIESRSDASCLLSRQMEVANLPLERVTQVIVSHLHEDHVGQLDAFARATFIAGPGTSAFAQEHGLADRWREVSSAALRASWPFERTQDLFGDGSVVLIHGGGHTREDLMVLVSLPEGPVLLTGDAVVHSDWLRSDDVQRIPVDAGLAARLRNQVRVLEHHPDVLILYGHELPLQAPLRADFTWHVRHNTDEQATCLM